MFLAVSLVCLRIIIAYRNKTAGEPAKTFKYSSALFELQNSTEFRLVWIFDCQSRD
jgi:hypothetical protein